MKAVSHAYVRGRFPAVVSNNVDAPLHLAFAPKTVGVRIFQDLSKKDGSFALEIGMVFREPFFV